ncbi:hypothetical protein ACVWXN_003494 [Bradyrhizobium sp. i1.4.4]
MSDPESGDAGQSDLARLPGAVVRTVFAFIFLLVMLLAANLLAQHLFPTGRGDGLVRRVGYYFVVVAIVAALVLCLAGLAALIGV